MLISKWTTEVSKLDFVMKVFRPIRSNVVIFTKFVNKITTFFYTLCR